MSDLTREAERDPTVPDAASTTPAVPAPVTAHGLSEREWEVLELVLGGCSNAEIADHLVVSVNTVKTHVRAAYAKIGVTGRTRAVLWGAQHGLSHRLDGHP